MVSHIVDINELNAGYSIQCTYTAPDKGTVQLNLEGDDNIVFHASIRYDSKTLVLNTLTHSWGVEERPPNFLFAPTYETTVRIDITHGGYEFYCNGKRIAIYLHRLDVGCVKKVRWDFSDNAAINKSVLKKMEINYP